MALLVALCGPTWADEPHDNGTTTDAKIAQYQDMSLGDLIKARDGYIKARNEPEAALAVLVGIRKTEADLNEPLRAEFVAYLAEYKRTLGQLDEALALYTRQLPHVADRFQRRVYNQRIGGIYYEQQHYDSCLAYSLRSLQPAPYFTDAEARLAGLNRMQIGACYIQQKEPSRALAMLETAEALLERHSPDNVPVVLQNIARAQKQAGQSAKALATITRAWQLAQQRPDLGIRIFVGNVAVDMLSSLGRQQEALSIQQEVNKAGHQQQQIENRRIMAEMEARYKAESNERENQRLRAENLANEADILKASSAILLGGVLIVLLLAALMVMRHKARQRRLESLAIAQEHRLTTDHNTSLQALNDTKDVLLSVISHDVRGPISTLAAVLHLIADGHLDESEKEMAMQTLRRDVDSVQQLLNDVLAWSKSQMSGFTPIISPVSPAIMMEELLEQAKPGAERLCVRLLYEGDAELVLESDEGMLRVIVRNVMANAIRHSPEYGTVYLTVERHARRPGHLHISIRDEGRGIDPATLAQLTDVHKMVSRVRARKDAGSGLGLALAHDFSAKIGAELRIESQINKGTTVSLTLPLDMGAPNAKPARAGTQVLDKAV